MTRTRGDLASDIFCIHCDKRQMVIGESPTCYHAVMKNSRMSPLDREPVNSAMPPPVNWQRDKPTHNDIKIVDFVLGIFQKIWTEDAWTTSVGEN